VQFVLVDGKGGPDYDRLIRRAWLSAKDDPNDVRDVLGQVHRLMVDRQASIAQVLGVTDAWHVGPSVRWPLVVVDEAHTFFHERKGTSGSARITPAPGDLLSRCGRDHAGGRERTRCALGDQPSIGMDAADDPPGLIVEAGIHPGEQQRHREHQPGRRHRDREPPTPPLQIPQAKPPHPRRFSADHGPNGEEPSSPVGHGQVRLCAP
jgi:hypothetical protein